MASHSEDKNFMCPYCQKTFKTNVLCKKHMKVHKADAQAGKQPIVPSKGLFINYVTQFWTFLGPLPDSPHLFHFAPRLMPYIKLLWKPINGLHCFEGLVVINLCFSTVTCKCNL